MSETLQPALPDDLNAQAERLMRRMCDAKLCIATAESCTGGMLAALLTDIEGAGHAFERGFVTYSNAAKTEMLGVDPALIARVGAVSEEVARAMAEGAIARSDADWAVAVTGIAGPGGAVPGKPVGTVWLALAGRNGPTTAERLQLGGDRAAVREQTVVQAFDRLIATVKSAP